MEEIRRQVNDGVCLALGYFDCLHLVHRKIIGEAILYASKIGAKSAVFTFFDEGMRDFKHELIHTYEERFSLFSSLGLDYVIPFIFDDNCRKMDKQTFLDTLFALADVKAVFCGYDYTFGHKGEGNVEFLKSYCADRGVEVFVTDKVSRKNEKISSTMIKDLLKLGKISEANDLLVSPYFICGEVVHGRGEGRVFGIPTANVAVSNDKVLPLLGVYATKTVIDGRIYTSVTNVGGKPTFGIDEVTIETLIKDYDGDLYGKNIKIEFYSYLRGVQRFDSPYELQRQIYRDIEWENNL